MFAPNKIAAMAAMAADGAGPYNIMTRGEKNPLKAARGSLEGT